MEEAKKQFCEKGFEGASVRDICDVVKANVSAIKYHFGGKEGLYRECFRSFGEGRLNKATQIQFVSFLLKQDVPVDKEGFYSLPLLNDTVQYSKLHEIKTIDSFQIDILSDIFSNVGYKGEIFKIEEIKCYDPRNAILFIDSTGKMFAYIEICFECRHIFTKPEKINIGDECNQKYDMMKKLFKNAGIVHGTTD